MFGLRVSVLPMEQASRLMRALPLFGFCLGRLKLGRLRIFGLAGDSGKNRLSAHDPIVAGVNFSFWKSQIDRLELKACRFGRISDAEACPEIDFVFKHEMWFPTFQQPMDELGLEFKGSVCADRDRDCSRRGSQSLAGRGSFVIGDTIMGEERSAAKVQTPKSNGS